MSFAFDATLKDLVRTHAADYLSVFDVPPTLPVSLLNVDLSTVTTAADVVIGLGEPLREIIHLDFQSSANAAKHLDVLVSNALLHRHYKVPVHSMLVLLRPRAAHSNMNGAVSYQGRPGRGKMDFGYEVVRLWEIPAQDLLAGAVGTSPLAPLGKFPEGGVRKGRVGRNHPGPDRPFAAGSPDGTVPHASNRGVYSDRVARPARRGLPIF